MLHGGVCHRTSAPHKSGDKMKEKKKKLLEKVLFDPIFILKLINFDSLWIVF